MNLEVKHPCQTYCPTDPPHEPGYGSDDILGIGPKEGKLLVVDNTQVEPEEGE